jgi:carbon monoxide dehydrogenase subunit G
MVMVERTFSVNQPMSTVVGYLKDFANAEAWDPGTRSCTRSDSGEIRAGSRWHNVSEFRGRQTELDYQLRTLDDNHLVFVGTNKQCTSTDDMSFSAKGSDGTSVTYRATIAFNGLLKLVGPIVKPGFEKLADETVERMTATLNGL